MTQSGTPKLYAFKLRHHLVILAAALMISFLQACLIEPAVAGKIYVYERADGSRLITDHLRHAKGYRLIKSYGSKKKRRYSSNRRRPLSPTSSKFDQLIAKTAQQHGVDTSLVMAVVQVESSFNPQAVSSAGATGLMQLMPATAKRFGVRNRVDPHQNVNGGVRYLSHLLELFEQNVPLALAAYNAGENAVRRYKGVPPYQETREYVRKVLDLHKLYLKKS